MNKTAIMGAMAMTIAAVGVYLPAGIMALLAVKLACAVSIGLLVYLLIRELQETKESEQLERLQSKTEADKALHTQLGVLGSLLEGMIKARPRTLTLGEYKQFHTEANKALLAQIVQLTEVVSLKLEEGVRGRQQEFLAHLANMAGENAKRMKNLENALGALGKMLESMIKARQETLGEYKQFHMEANKALLAQLVQLTEGVSLKLEEGMRGRQQEFLAQLENMAGENGKVLKSLADHLKNTTKEMSDVAINLSESASKEIVELSAVLRDTSKENASLMKNLADEYKQFEATTEEMIKRMTSLAREDFELLKDLLK